MRPVKTKICNPVFYLTPRAFFWITVGLLVASTMVYISIVPVKSVSFSWPSYLPWLCWPNNNRSQVKNTDPLLEAARKVQDSTSTLLVPVINNAYLPFANNWLCNTKEMGLHKRLLIITADDTTRDKLLHDWPKVNIVSMNVSTLSGDTAYGQAGFVKNNAKRHEYIYRLLKAGYDVLHFDFDQVWLRNPLPVLQGQANLGYDFLVMRVGTTLKEYCSGFVYIFNTKKAIKLWKELAVRLADYSRRIANSTAKQSAPIFMIDQNTWSKLVNNKTVEGLSYKLLPLEDFADGPAWYGKPKAYQNTSNPFVIHNNFIKGNAAKMARAKQFHHWFLDNNMKCNMSLVHNIVKTE